MLFPSEDADEQDPPPARPVPAAPRLREGLRRRPPRTAALLHGARADRARPSRRAGVRLVAVAPAKPAIPRLGRGLRSEEHTSELQSLMRISYAFFCLKKKKQTID